MLESRSALVPGKMMQSGVKVYLLLATAAGVSAAALLRLGRRRGGSKSAKGVRADDPRVARPATIAGPPPGTKKGVGMATGAPQKGKARASEATRLRGGWEARVAALRPSWFYSWGPGSPQVLESAPPGVEFVPMVFGGKNLGRVRERVGAIREQHAQGTCCALLGFNEPDGHEQANMSVERALEVWPELEAAGVLLGSPAAIKANRPWMAEFMAGAKLRGCQVDFVTVHWYSGLSVENFVKHLHEVHEAYGLPIWITEFGVADYKAKDLSCNRFTAEQVQDFMREVLPRLDALDFVHRYAWFCFDQSSRVGHVSALFRADNTLTELGHIYANHQAPTNTP
mmetsp:Transcript_35912/g.90569  ORF Transcript_35912/g.90569 Transcript_35912/m.90569 type:complete len:341 (-) Transcript_35912:376-1398(-)